MTVRVGSGEKLQLGPAKMAARLQGIMLAGLAGVQFEGATPSPATMIDVQAQFKSDDDLPLLPNLIPLPHHYEPGPSHGGTYLTLANIFTFSSCTKSRVS